MKKQTVLILLTMLTISSFTAYAQDSVAVDVYQPKETVSAQILPLIGTVEAVQHAQLAVLESGVIGTLYVEAGDKVKAGEKLLSLDSTLARLTLQEAKATVTAADVALQEAERLYQEVLALSTQQLVAETLIAERRASLATAKATLSQQRANLALQQEVVNRQTLFAPFTGTVAQRFVSIGEWVTQQTPVLTLVGHNDLRIAVAIPQEYYPLLANHENIHVSVTPDFSNAEAFTAQLNRVVTVSDANSRTLIGHISLSQQSGLLVGMSARADIALPSQEQSIVWLPNSALKLHPDGGTSVFAVVNSRAQRVLVEVVERKAGMVAVNNAKGGVDYVVSGIELLQDNDRVTVASREDPAQ